MPKLHLAELERRITGEVIAASLRLAAAGEDNQQPTAHLFGIMLDGEAATSELLEEFVARVGSEPEATSRRHLPFRTAKRALVGVGAAEGEQDEGQPELLFHKSELFRRPLPRETISELLRAFTVGRSQAESRELSFTPLGGAYNRVPEDATAFAHVTSATCRTRSRH